VQPGLGAGIACFMRASIGNILASPRAAMAATLTDGYEDQTRAPFSMKSANVPGTMSRHRTRHFADGASP
jgi:hypothetical protein